MLDAAAQEDAEDARIAQQPAGGGRDGRGGRAAARRIRATRPREDDARRVRQGGVQGVEHRRQASARHAAPAAAG
eukprot:160774-Prymnesium_polylepis.1